MVVFPVQIGDVREDNGTLSYQGTLPDGTKLNGFDDLVGSVVSGLFVVDYPLQRFDGWLTTNAPVIQGESIAQSSQALSCTDAAVVPRLEEAVADVSEGMLNNMTLKLSIDVYQRRDNLLVLTDTVMTDTPGILDTVEDIMQATRRATIERLQKSGDAAKVAKKTKDAASVVRAVLPAEQQEAMHLDALEAELNSTRVASISRSATVWPLLDVGVASPAEIGLHWRTIEVGCYEDVEDEREDIESASFAAECGVLNRVRQAVRNVQLETRKVDEFRLKGPVDHQRGRRISAFPLGEEEGLRIGDGYVLRDASKGRRMGYARVKRVGIGGLDGTVAPSKLHTIYGRRGSPDGGVVAQEKPQLGIEVGGWGGMLSAQRPTSLLPPNPATGEERLIIGGAYAPAGQLRFDVNLGRTVGAYEFYQTNRISMSMASEDLTNINAVFGLERRFLVLPRTYLVLGGGMGLQMWAVPSGVQVTQEDGDVVEPTAAASQASPEVEVGVVAMITPSIMLRASAGYRIAGDITEFKWTEEEQEGVVIPQAHDGSPFVLSTQGLVGGVSTSWVF